MPLSRDEVEHVASLAHIGLQPGEVDELTVQLSSIIDHIARLQEIDTTSVEPTAHTLLVDNVMRDDVDEPPWPPTAVLANAPRRADDFFEVQAILD
jgi:aspartyl-tRNA(Asn)/glutamyl-tRNA(Gln) amidotransferase subunit C